MTRLAVSGRPAQRLQQSVVIASARSLPSMPGMSPLRRPDPEQPPVDDPAAYITLAGMGIKA